MGRGGSTFGQRWLVCLLAACLPLAAACSGGQPTKALSSPPTETGTVSPAGSLAPPVSSSTSSQGAPSGCWYQNSGWPTTAAPPQTYIQATMTVHVTNRGLPVPEAVLSEGAAVGASVVVADGQGRAVISDLSVNDRCEMSLALLQNGQPTMLWRDVAIKPGLSDITLDLSSATPNDSPAPPTCDHKSGSAGSLQVVVFGVTEASVMLLPDNTPLTSQGSAFSVPGVGAPHGDICSIDLRIGRAGADPVVIHGLFDDDRAEVVDFVQFTT